MFSQAPRTEIMVPCSVSGEEFVNIICQDNGQWLPDPNTLNEICFQSDSTKFKISSPIPSETSSFKAFLIPIFVLVGTVAVVLCLAVVLIVVCIWRATVAKKRRERELSIVEITNCIYDEVVGPVYAETINVIKESASGERVSMTNNEAYESVFSKQTNFASLESDVDVTSNGAYYVIPFCRNVMSLERNESCNTAIHLNSLVATNCKDFECTQLVCHGKHQENFSENHHELLLLNQFVNNTNPSQKVDLNQGQSCSQNHSSMSLDKFESFGVVEKTSNPKLNTLSPKIPLKPLLASNSMVTFDKQTLNNYDHEESQKQYTG